MKEIFKTPENFLDYMVTYAQLYRHIPGEVGGDKNTHSNMSNLKDGRTNLQ